MVSKPGSNFILLLGKCSVVEETLIGWLEKQIELPHVLYPQSEFSLSSSFVSEL